eukprot:7728901-Alexandrium_andersonii.AAC.1
MPMEKWGNNRSLKIAKTQRGARRRTARRTHLACATPNLRTLHGRTRRRRANASDGIGLNGTAGTSTGGHRFHTEHGWCRTRQGHCSRGSMGCNCGTGRRGRRHARGRATYGDRYVQRTRDPGEWFCFIRKCFRGPRTARWSKNAQHPPRRPCPRPLWARLGGWLRDLTADGD